MASQLQPSEVQGNRVSNPYKTPSILYSPEEAGGFNCEYIYEIGQKGLGVLQQEDSRFKNYIVGKKRRGINDVKFSYNIWDLFRHKEEIDRDSLGKDDFDQIKASISSYLRLLSDYMQFPAALDTLEYLLRIYKIHIYDWEDLISCSLPYHHKPEFFRIVQLLCPNGNSKWDFLLDNVKQSSAPLPRWSIIKACLGDMQILNSMCEYACESRTKKSELSKSVFMFTTAIILAASTNITTIDEVKPVIFFLEQAILSGGSYRACALIIICQLSKVPLRHSSILTWIVKTCQDDNWVRLSVFTLINFVKLQSVTSIPRIILVDLIKIKDFAKVLLGVSEEFKITRFLDLLLDSFLHSYDTYEHRFSEALASIINTVPMKINMVDLTSKVLSKCMILQGHWARTVLLAIRNKYPDELLEAVENFLDNEIQTELKLEMLSQMMDFCKLDKVALGLAYKTTLLKSLRDKAQELGKSSSQDKIEFVDRELNVDDITIELFGKMCEELVRDTSGNARLAIAFNTLGDLVMKMDRSSIASILEKILGHCLVALDVRHKNPEAMQNNDDDEKSVINAIVFLTKRLTESELKLLFQRSIDWAESDIIDGSGRGYKSIDRAISFYGLVNELCEAYGSILVPCFREILDQIISHLTKDSVSSRKAKKAKTQLVEDGIPLKSWHLMALVLSSLKNCFLHDTGSVRFLDRNNLQALLETILSQAVVKPPSSLKEHPHVPAVEKVDEWLVSCIAQMATSYSDLLLKHEVPKEARSESLRRKISRALQGLASC